MMQLDPIVAQESRKERRANPNPHSKYEVKAMISPVFSYGRSEPKAGCHWITDLGIKDPATPENLSQIENTYLCSNPHHELALLPHPSPWSLSWGPSGNLRIASRAYTGGNPRTKVGSKMKQELWIWELESRKIDLKQQKQVAAGGVKPKLPFHFIMAVAIW